MAELRWTQEPDLVIEAHALYLVCVFTDEAYSCVRCSNNISRGGHRKPGCGQDFDVKRTVADFFGMFIEQSGQCLPVSGARGVVSVEPLGPAAFMKAEVEWTPEANFII